MGKIVYCILYLTSVPERSKGVDLRSTASASWVRIPPLVFCSISSVVERCAYDATAGGSIPSWSNFFFVLIIYLIIILVYSL
jgi:hypothetical protein